MLSLYRVFKKKKKKKKKIRAETIQFTILSREKSSIEKILLLLKNRSFSSRHVYREIFFSMYQIIKASRYTKLVDGGFSLKNSLLFPREWESTWKEEKRKKGKRGTVRSNISRRIMAANNTPRRKGVLTMFALACHLLSYAFAVHSVAQR